MTETMSSDRLEAFRADVADLKIGGKNPAKWERVASILGLIAMIAGVIVAFAAYSTAQNAGELADIHRQQVLAVASAALAIVGAIVWLRVSLTRHLRWWMIRSIHEQRSLAERDR